MSFMQDFKKELLSRVRPTQSAALPSVELRAKMLDGYDSTGYLVFDEDEVIFHGDFTNVGDIVFRAEDIADIEVTGNDEQRERFTLTRLLLFKHLALAFPKKTDIQNTLLDILTVDNQVSSFYIDDLSPQDAWRKIAHIVNSYSKTEVSEEAYAPTVSEQLEQVAKLHSEGMLTDEEFTQAKQTIMNNASEQ
jgi:hypothetical protein